MGTSPPLLISLQAVECPLFPSVQGAQSSTITMVPHVAHAMFTNRAPAATALTVPVHDPRTGSVSHVVAQSAAIFNGVRKRME